MRRNKTTAVLLAVLFPFLLVASIITVWWMRRRATPHIADRGTLATLMSSQHRPLSIPSPVYLRPTRSECFRMANAPTATPSTTRRHRPHWTNPEVVLAVLSVILTVIGLVLGGLSLLYARRAVPKS